MTFCSDVALAIELFPLLCLACGWNPDKIRDERNSSNIPIIDGRCLCATRQFFIAVLRKTCGCD